MRRTQPTTTNIRVRPFKRAAEESGFCYSTLRDAHFRGELAVVKVGRAWYLEDEELARFVERQTERGAG
jgi:hypothetical protein